MNVFNDHRLSNEHWAVFLMVVLVLVFGWYARAEIANQTEYETRIRNDAKDYYLYAANLKYDSSYSRPRVATAELVPDAVRPLAFPSFLSPGPQIYWLAIFALVELNRYVRGKFSLNRVSQ